MTTALLTAYLVVALGIVLLLLITPSGQMQLGRAADNLKLGPFGMTVFLLFVGLSWPIAILLSMIRRGK